LGLRERPDAATRRRRAGGRAANAEEGEATLLKEGDKAPKVTGTTYDGRTFDIGAPSRRTVLWFYPKANTGG